LQNNDGLSAVQLTAMFTEKQVRSADGAIQLAYGPPAGPPLLFLHGVGRCWQDFLPLAALASRWQLYALDFRGHGKSDRVPGKYLVRDHVRDAVAIVRDEIRQPVVVFGHSLGALVAAALAAELPQLVRGIILEDPPINTVGPDIQSTSFYSLFQVMAAASGSKKSVAELANFLADARILVPGRTEPARLGDFREASSLRYFAACLKRVDPQVWEPVIAGRWLEGYDPASIFPKINYPTLLLQGEVETGGMLDDRTAEKAAQWIPDCLHVRVEGAGHLLHSLQTETTLRYTTFFLESILLGGEGPPVERVQG